MAARGVRIAMSESIRIKFRAKCPGCGKRLTSTREADAGQASLECDRCHTRFSLTFMTDSGELERDFRLGKDVGEAARKIY